MTGGKMSDHRYRITVEHLADCEGNPASQEPLVFETTMHDNLFKIVPLAMAKNGLDQQEAAAFVVGLKLFGKVLKKHSEDSLFSSLQPHFLEFMKSLKSRPVRRNVDSEL
jgi:hypothetical protein